MLRALVGAAVLGGPAAALADVPERANFDARPEGDGTPPAAVERAGDRLRERLGHLGTLSHDPRTGTLRAVGRLDGFLTGPSGRAGEDVALGYVSDNATAFGLDGDDIDGLRLVDREFVDGVEHLSWEQRFRGVPAVDAGLEAAVTGSGRLVALTGPPAADLAVRSVEPAVGARAAYDAARDSAGAGGAPAAIASASSGAEQATRFDDGGRASLALYSGESGYRLAWRVLAPVSSTGVYDVVVDARSGAVVRRANRVNFANANVYRHSPAHPEGPQTVLLDPWLSPGATTLTGPNAHAFADETDVVGFDDATDEWNLVPEPGSDVAPGEHDLLPSGAGDCQPAGETSAPPCTWDPDDPLSWEANRAQSVNQLFYLVNNFHDHLKNDPNISFDEANFERTGQPLGDPNSNANAANSDPVLAQALDGANSGGTGLPDGDHDNNANFLTLPDGLPGLMQIYLSRSPTFGSYDGVNDATIVYHEYTHGLSNRLVTDPQGFGALNTEQAGALGEGWSDFYAMDYLDEEGLEVDDAGVADVHVGSYLDNRTAPLFRWQGLDCTPSTLCQNPVGPADGNGFTYGDFGKVANGDDIHADGEIWGQTLWSIRAALIAEYTQRHGGDAVAGRAAGIARTREYVTDGMRFAPDEPSFIDARNGILLASELEEDDEVMWKVFADRGMGYFAGSDGSDDTTPTPDDTDVDDLDGVGTLSGTVVDENGDPLEGATVGLAELESALGEQARDETDADGQYSIEDVRTRADRRYPTVLARKPGFMEDRATDVEVVNEVQGTTPPLNFHLTRDFSSGEPAPTAAKVVSFTGPNNTASGCGPGELIDDDQGTVWGTNRDDAGPGADLVGQEIVVELAAPVDVGLIAIDPGAGCGDDNKAALGAYEVLGARTPNGPFVSLRSGAFGASVIGTLAEAFSGHENSIRYIKLHAQSPQFNTGSGAQFLDVAEMHVARVPSSPVGAAADTGAAQGVSSAGATLTGSVVPHGGPAQVFFQYGVTSNYTATVAAGSTPAGHTAAPVTAGVGGLQPSTTYHYRVVAVRDGREYHGGNQTFTTAAAPQSPPQPPPQQPPQPPANPPSNPPSNPPAAVRPTVLLDTKLSAKRNGTFKVRAFFGDAAPAGTARFRVIGRKSKRYAQATTPVRIGGNVIKTLKLTRKGRRAIKPGRSKRVTLELRLPNGQKFKKSLRLARAKR